MMTAREAHDLLSRVRYKPGWRFYLEGRDGDYAGFLRGHDLMMVIEADVPDSRYTGDPAECPLVSIRKPVSLSLMIDGPHFLRWLRHQIIEMEVHELDEFLRYDGELVNDPHRARLVLNDTPVPGAVGKGE